MTNAKSLIEALNAEFAHERVFIDALPEPSRAGHGSPEAWSAKDLQDHLTAWKHQTVLRLRGDPSAVIEASDEDTDRINAVFFEASASQSWNAVLHDAHATHVDLNQALSRLSDAELADPERFPWQDGLPLWRRLAGTLLLHPWMHMAEHALERGDPQAAVNEAEAMLEHLERVCRHTQLDGFAALQHGLHLRRAGDTDRALDRLGSALSMRPDLVEWSKQDSDLESLRSDDRLAAMYAQLEG